MVIINAGFHVWSQLVKKAILNIYVLFYNFYLTREGID